jgi:hypothetical protein
MQAVRPPHTRATDLETHQMCFSVAPDVSKRRSSVSGYCGPILVSRSSQRSAPRQNTSVKPILVSRSPESCGLLTTVCGRNARRAPRFLVPPHISGTPQIRALDNCHCSEEIRLSRFHRPPDGSGAPRVSRTRHEPPCVVSKRPWCAYGLGAPNDHAGEPHDQWFERRSSGSGRLPHERKAQAQDSACCARMPPERCAHISAACFGNAA